MRGFVPATMFALGRHALAMIVVCSLAACSSVEVHTVNIQTAATGTQIEAKQVIALIYNQAPEADIEKLLYSTSDLPRTIKRLRSRYLQLKPWLDQGTIGNTASGFVALRDESKRAEVSDLLWDENRDRAFLYTQTSVAVGHGSHGVRDWLPYASYSFGAQWTSQGQPGWWCLDEQQQWQQK